MKQKINIQNLFCLNYYKNINQIIILILKFEETIKNQNYFKIVLDILNLNKENFISKYQN